MEKILAVTRPIKVCPLCDLVFMGGKWSKIKPMYLRMIKSSEQLCNKHQVIKGGCNAN